MSTHDRLGWTTHGSDRLRVGPAEGPGSPQILDGALRMIPRRVKSIQGSSSPDRAGFFLESPFAARNFGSHPVVSVAPWAMALLQSRRRRHRSRRVRQRAIAVGSDGVLEVGSRWAINSLTTVSPVSDRSARLAAWPIEAPGLAPRPTDTAPSLKRIRFWAVSYKVLLKAD
jgi:hypothetical protein